MSTTRQTYLQTRALLQTHVLLTCRKLFPFKFFKTFTMASNRNLDHTKSSMDVAALNNLVVSLRPTVKQIRVQLIHKLTNNIKALRKKRGKEEQVLANNKKADRIVEEIKILKGLKEDTVSKFSLGNETPFEEAAKQGNQENKALTRIACHKLMLQKVLKWREEHSDWKELAAFIKSKNTGRRFKKGAKAKIDPDSVNQMPVNAKKQLERQGDIDSIEKSGSLGDRLLQITQDMPPEVKSESEDDSEIDKESFDSEAFDEDVAEKDRAPTGHVKTSQSKKLPVARSAVNTVDTQDSEEASSSEPDISDEEDLFASNSSGVSDDSDAELSRGDAAAEEPEPSHDVQGKKSVIRACRDTVVKRLNLDEWDPETQVEIEAPKEKEENVSFLFSVEEADTGPKKSKKDSFFAMDDESESEEESDSGIEQTQPMTVDDVEFDKEKLREAVESTFLGSLCSRGSKPTKRGNFRKQQINQNYRPTWQQMKDEERKLKNMAPGRRKQYERQAAFLKKDRISGPATGSSSQRFGRNKPANDKGGRIANDSKKQEELHPSWEASKKRKEMASKIVPFQGKKIKFDDDD